MKRLRHPVRAVREPFGTAGLIVACVALVLALTGAAFAATKLNSTQKKEVEKIAKKYAGKPGAPGAQGAAGANGKDGAAGAAGAKGATGAQGSPGAKGATGAAGKAGATGEDGKSVEVTKIDTGTSECEGRGGSLVFVEGSSPEEVCNGKEGQQGPKGEPWAPEDTLPPGAQETGAWAFTGSTADTNGIWVPISFAIPLPGALAEENVHYQGEAGFEVACPGTTAFPQAEQGQLCVYENAQEKLQNTTFQEINKIAASPGFKGANRSGAMIIFTAPTGPASGSGSFAVRAPEAP